MSLDYKQLSNQLAYSDFEYLLDRSLVFELGDSSCRLMFIANPELALPTFRMTVSSLPPALVTIETCI